MAAWFEREIQNLIFEAVREEHKFLESMCEMSLVDPEGRGILVEIRQDGSMDARLSKDVPWMTIHKHHI